MLPYFGLTRLLLVDSRFKGVYSIALVQADRNGLWERAQEKQYRSNVVFPYPRDLEVGFIVS